MSKKELIAGSLLIFGANRDLNEVFATTDGQYFFEENRAELYKKTKRDSKTGKDSISVIQITKDEAKELASELAKETKPKKSEFLQQNVGEIKEALKTADDVEALKGYLAEEKEHEPRTTAISAIEARIEELENPIE